MVAEFKDNGSTIEDGVTKDDAKQACTLCLNEFKKNMLTPFDLNKDQREYPLCSTCLSKINGTYENPQGSSPAIYTNSGVRRNFDSMRRFCNKRRSCSCYCLFVAFSFLVFFIFIAVRYFSQDYDDATFDCLQNQDKIYLIVCGCIAFGIPYIVIVIHLFQKYDIFPMLKRTFRRS